MTYLHEDLWEIVPATGCYLWRGTLFASGYGRLGNKRTHRLVWEEVNGTIPKGLFVLHRCDVKCCGNIQHLFLGSLSDNMQDMVNKGRNPDFNGCKHPNAVLTEAQVIEIRTCNASDFKLGKMYGVSRRTIQNVRQGRRYASVGHEQADKKRP